MPEIVRNVFGEPLVPCSFDPLTGFFRDGCCKTNDEDVGLHLVCAIMSDEFLEFSRQRGNDLITPRPEWNFPGLHAGDQCLRLRVMFLVSHSYPARLIRLRVSFGMAAARPMNTMLACIWCAPS